MCKLSHLHYMEGLARPHNATAGSVFWINHIMVWWYPVGCIVWIDICTIKLNIHLATFLWCFNTHHYMVHVSFMILFWKLGYLSLNPHKIVLSLAEDISYASYICIVSKYCTSITTIIFDMSDEHCQDFFTADIVSIKSIK